MSSLPASATQPASDEAATAVQDSFGTGPDAPAAARSRIAVLVVVPSLDGGASDDGAVELVRVLAGNGHSPILVSRAGRLVADVTSAGVEFVPLDVSSNNPIVMLRNAVILARLVRERGCDAIHAFGRAGAWSAFIAARLDRKSVV